MITNRYNGPGMIPNSYGHPIHMIMTNSYGHRPSHLGSQGQHRILHASINRAIHVGDPRCWGIWAVWDQPAEGVMEAARANGKDDLIITTIDLGENVAIAIAKGGPVYGLGAQRPFDQGVTEAKLAGYGLLGKEAPPYVALPALPVEKGNILDAWSAVYYQDAPNSIVKSLD